VRYSKSLLIVAVLSSLWAAASTSLLAGHTQPGAASLPLNPPGRAEELQKLVAQLDSNRFAARQHAERVLLEVGFPALEWVDRAAASASIEVRHRAERISYEIQHRALSAEFYRLGDLRDDARLDLEHAMFLISRIGNPRIRESDLSRQLDALAARVRSRLGARPSEVEPRRAIEALCDVLFREQGFSGNRAEFDDPDNSSLERVLATRKGLPILLSQIMICVGKRLDIPLVGLQIPGRYMVKYDAPSGKGHDEIVIDAFDGGRLLTIDELEDVVAGFGSGFDPRTHLTAASRRRTLARMLRNLANDYEAAGRLKLAERTACYYDLVTRYDPDPDE
jgi:regulator of sirC expression with transglutaminase-like and TPR domain